MLAYRHGFHAGNHGDVLKHLVLVLLLQHMNHKHKGYRFIDTHAGGGLYALDSPQALKTGEFGNGIGRIAAAADPPAVVNDYLALVRSVNDNHTPLRLYPGSPLLARRLLRPQDELRLFELHPSEHRDLAAQFAAAPGVTVRQADGFAALRGELPPPTRRAVVLIDPSYEGHGDYATALTAVREGLARFETGMFMVWYPLVGKPGAAALVNALKAAAPGAWVHAQLRVQRADALGFGMTGSGILVVNPPYTLHDRLRDLLPWLLRALMSYAGAGQLLEQQAG